MKLKIEHELGKKLKISSRRSQGRLADIRIYPIVRDISGFNELCERHRLAESGQPNGSRALSKIFRLDVGGGMKAWRRFVFDQLSRYSEADRNRIWHEIDTAIRKHERKEDIPPGIEGQFPKTFEEAKKYYAL